MPYFNYHAVAKNLIKNNKLIRYEFVEKHNRISPALILHFDDAKHPLMPVKKEYWNDYLYLISQYYKRES